MYRTGTVVANSIAFEFLVQSNIFPHWRKANSNSIVKTVPQLDKNFARIQVVRSAKRKTIVEQDAPVGDVDALQVDGESFPETFAEGKVERGVRPKMVAGHVGIAVCEAGRVIHVRRGVGMEWQIVARAEMQSVALVMIEETEAATKRKVRQAAVDIAKRKRKLIGIS